jgi:hypothetical protein
LEVPRLPEWKGHFASVAIVCSLDCQKGMLSDGSGM